MNQRIRVALAGSALAIAASGCGADAQSDSEDSPITIGVVNAQNGFMAQLDMPATEGVRLAVEDINADGGILGRKLEVIEYDTKSEQTLSSRGASQLVADGADVLVTSCDFDFGAPAATVAQQSDKLVFGCIALPAFAAGATGDNAFSVESLTTAEGATAAEWAHAQGWENVAVLTDTFLEYSKSVGENFVTRWTELGGAESIVYNDTFKNDDSSFDTQVAGVRTAQPDAIFISSCPPGGATLTRALRAAGIETPIVAGICMDGDYWLKSVPNLENFYNIAEVSTYGDDPRAEVNDFVARLEGDANTTQPIYAVEGYSMIQAYKIAAERAGTAETSAVQKELEKFSDEPLLLGPTTFTDELHGDDTRPYAVLEVVNGEHRFVERHQAVQVPPVD